MPPSRLRARKYTAFTDEWWAALLFDTETAGGRRCSTWHYRKIQPQTAPITRIRLMDWCTDDDVERVPGYFEVRNKLAVKLCRYTRGLTLSDARFFARTVRDLMPEEFRLPNGRVRITPAQHDDD